MDVQHVSLISTTSIPLSKRFAQYVKNKPIPATAKKQRANAQNLSRKAVRNDKAFSKRGMAKPKVQAPLGKKPASKAGDTQKKFSVKRQPAATAANQSLKTKAAKGNNIKKEEPKSTMTSEELDQQLIFYKMQTVEGLDSALDEYMNQNDRDEDDHDGSEDGDELYE